MAYRLASAVGPCRYRLPYPEVPLAQSSKSEWARSKEKISPRPKRLTSPRRRAHLGHPLPAPYLPPPSWGLLGPPWAPLPQIAGVPATLAPPPTPFPRFPQALDPPEPTRSSLIPSSRYSPKPSTPRTRMCPSSGCPVPPDRTDHLTEPRCPLSVSPPHSLQRALLALESAGLPSTHCIHTS